MEIQRIEKYKLKGKEYNSLKEIKTDTENHLGVIIDSMDVTLTPKQKLNILSGLVKNRKLIVELLTREVDLSDDAISGHFKNILDI